MKRGPKHRSAFDRGSGFSRGLPGPAAEIAAESAKEASEAIAKDRRQGEARTQRVGGQN